MKTSVIGIGKLGLCFALTMEKNGIDVVGMDISSEYVKKLNEKAFRSSEPYVDEYLEKSNNFLATTSLEEALNHADILFVIVDTPSFAPDFRYNHSNIDTVVNELISFGEQKTKKHLVISCTTMPGYCDTIHDRLSHLNYSVSYNPEFIAQGTILKNQANPDIVLIGGDSPAEIINVYMRIIENLHEVDFVRMDRLSAEIAKLALNCFCTTKISFANMIGDLAKKVHANPELILEALGSDSRIGSKYLKYGFGYGGPCFPRDNKALALFAEENEMPLDISKATDSINVHHLKFMINDFIESGKKRLVMDRMGKYKDDSNDDMVFKHGVAFKEGSVILEESQRLKFAVRVAECGYPVLISDLNEVIEEVKGIYGSLFIYM